MTEATTNIFIALGDGLGAPTSVICGTDGIATLFKTRPGVQVQ